MCSRTLRRALDHAARCCRFCSPSLLAWWYIGALVMRRSWSFLRLLWPAKASAGFSSDPFFSHYDSAVTRRLLSVCLYDLSPCARWPLRVRLRNAVADMAPTERATGCAMLRRERERSRRRRSEVQRARSGLTLQFVIVGARMRGAAGVREDGERQRKSCPVHVLRELFGTQFPSYAFRGTERNKIGGEGAEIATQPTEEGS